MIDSIGINEQLRWERDSAIEQLRSYGVELFEEADVKRVVHGHWVGEGEVVRCSVCTEHPLRDMDMDSVYYWKYEPSYCPNCGAKMDEKRKADAR